MYILKTLYAYNSGFGSVVCNNLKKYLSCFYIFHILKLSKHTKEIINLIFFQIKYNKNKNYHTSKHFRSSFLHFVSIDVLRGRKRNLCEFHYRTTSTHLPSLVLPWD
jgi:hypothetical protein